MLYTVVSRGVRRRCDRCSSRICLEGINGTSATFPPIGGEEGGKGLGGHGSSASMAVPPAERASAWALDKRQLLKRAGHVLLPVAPLPYGQLYGGDGNSGGGSGGGGGSGRSGSSGGFQALKRFLGANMEGGEGEGAAIRSLPPYVFDDKLAARSASLAASLPPPPQLARLVSRCGHSRSQFVLGPRGSGAHMHAHQAAWNALYVGERSGGSS